MIFIQIVVCFLSPSDRHGGEEVERWPRMREIGLRFSVATDLSKKTGSESSTAKRSAKGVIVTGPRR